jgi:hypothetical protein
VKNPGDVLRIDWGNGEYAFGRVLRPPLVAAYDATFSSDLPVKEIVERPLLFRLPVMDYATEDGVWQVIGHVPVRAELITEPWFCWKDPITGELTRYHDSTGQEIPAEPEDRRSLECAAVWDPEHVADRLRDHFAGRGCRWVESMCP